MKTFTFVYQDRKNKSTIGKTFVAKTKAENLQQAIKSRGLNKKSIHIWNVAVN